MPVQDSGPLPGPPACRALRPRRFLGKTPAQKLTDSPAEMGNLVGVLLQNDIRPGIAFVEPEGVDETGQQDHWRDNFPRADLGDKFNARHQRQSVVGDNHIETGINQTIESVLRAGNRSDTISLLLEYCFTSLQTQIVVVHEEQVCMSDRSGNSKRRHSGKELTNTSVRLSTVL